MADLVHLSCTVRCNNNLNYISGKNFIDYSVYCKGPILCACHITDLLDVDMGI